MNYHWNWHVFFEPSPNGTGTYLDMLLSGLVVTIVTALAAWLIALATGTVVGVMRTLPSKAANLFGFCYVEFFRNMPLLVQLFLWFFVLPELSAGFLGAVAEADFLTRRSIPRRSGSGCSCRRASPNKRGPASIRCRAARGLRPPHWACGHSQVYRYVLLPIAFRIILPPLTSEFLSTIKNTSVALTIGLIELTAEARAMQEFSFQVFEAFTAATVLYLLINIVVVIAMHFVERGVAIPGYITGK